MLRADTSDRSQLHWPISFGPVASSLPLGQALAGKAHSEVHWVARHVHNLLIGSHWGAGCRRKRCHQPAKREAVCCCGTRTLQWRPRGILPQKQHLWPKKTPRQPANHRAPAKRCCNQRPNNIVLLGFGGYKNGCEILEESSFKI